MKILTRGMYCNIKYPLEKVSNKQLPPPFGSLPMLYSIAIIIIITVLLLLLLRRPRQPLTVMMVVLRDVIYWHVERCSV